MSHARIPAIKELLVRLLGMPSPSGNTEAILTELSTHLSELQIATRRNHKGGLLFTLQGTDNTRHRLITAHVDTLGGMVKEVLNSGRLRLAKVGGYAWTTIEGEYCKIHTASGKTYTGTIMLQNTSVHVNREVDTTLRTQKNIEVVLDERVTDKEDVKSLGISVGDFISFDPRIQVTDTGFIKSRHLDDKASVAIIIELVTEFLEKGITLPHTTHVLISNNEEIGYGGNSNIPSETVEYLAVDMGAIGKGQSTDEYCVSICALDGSGPYHLGLRSHLTKLAQANGLYYQVDIYPYYGSDASAAIKSGADIVHGLIGPGVANSHAYERMHEEALVNTYELLKAYLVSPMTH